MKKSTNKLTLLLLAGLLTTAILPAQQQKKKLTGLWHMMSGKVNGKPVPAQLTNRVWIFNSDNSFEGKKFVNGDFYPYNAGIYMLPTDTTMVCLHKYSNGKLDRIAFVYNYTISNDSLHLYGFYLIGTQVKPGLLQPVHIDEWWIKSKK